MSRFEGTHTGGVRFPAPSSAALQQPGLLTAVLALLIALSITSCVAETPTLEERAQTIDQRLMCPVCPAETIDQSQADVAIQMRDLVREKLRVGESEEEIFDFFVERYDKGVLAEPPAEGFNILVWVIPPLALLLGLALVWVGFKHLARSPHRHVTASGAEWEADAERYLREVDEEFEAFRQGAGADAAPGQGG